MHKCDFRLHSSQGRIDQMITFTINELEPILRLKPRAIRRLINHGQLQARLVGRQFLVSEALLRQFLEGT